MWVGLKNSRLLSISAFWLHVLWGTTYEAQIVWKTSSDASKSKEAVGAGQTPHVAQIFLVVLGFQLCPIRVQWQTRVKFQRERSLETQTALGDEAPILPMTFNFEAPVVFYLLFTMKPANSKRRTRCFAGKPTSSSSHCDGVRRISEICEKVVTIPSTFCSHCTQPQKEQLKSHSKENMIFSVVFNMILWLRKGSLKFNFW